MSSAGNTKILFRKSCKSHESRSVNSSTLTAVTVTKISNSIFHLDIDTFAFTKALQSKLPSYIALIINSFFHTQSNSTEIHPIFLHYNSDHPKLAATKRTYAPRQEDQRLHQEARGLTKFASHHEPIYT